MAGGPGINLLLESALPCYVDYGRLHEEDAIPRLCTLVPEVYIFLSDERNLYLLPGKF